MLIKPFDDGVFDFTYSLEICEILLELVAINHTQYSGVLFEAGPKAKLVKLLALAKDFA